MKVSNDAKDDARNSSIFLDEVYFWTDTTTRDWEELADACKKINRNKIMFVGIGFAYELLDVVEVDL